MFWGLRSSILLGFAGYSLKIPMIVSMSCEQTCKPMAPPHHLMHHAKWPVSPVLQGLIFWFTPRLKPPVCIVGGYRPNPLFYFPFRHLNGGTEPCRAKHIDLTYGRHGSSRWFSLKNCGLPAMLDIQRLVVIITLPDTPNSYGRLYVYPCIYIYIICINIHIPWYPWPLKSPLHSH